MKGGFEWSFTIDKLTNSLEDAATGKSFSTLVVKLEQEDLGQLTRRRKWQFNWKQEWKDELKTMYKIVLEDEPETIQGIVSIKDSQDHIFMPLIETAPHNYGKQKKYYGVLPNLVAFVCKKSFENGYRGEVAFDSKTSLIEHYSEKLGAQILFGNRMAILEPQAKKLVSLYFKDFIT